jgi:hypothetical protein
MMKLKTTKTKEKRYMGPMYVLNAQPAEITQHHLMIINHFRIGLCVENVIPLNF